MSTNENPDPQDEKTSTVDMRSALLPQPPAEVDLRATASAPPSLSDEQSPTVVDPFASEPAETEAATAMEGVATPYPPAEEFGSVAAIDAPPLGSALGAVETADAVSANTAEEEAPEEEDDRPGFFARLSEHFSGYDALLLLAFLALVLGTLAMASELSRYDWDRHAKSGRRPVSAATVVSLWHEAAV